MKAKQIQKTVEQLATEIVAKKKITVVQSVVKGYGDYDGIGIEWEEPGFHKAVIVSEKKSAKDICRLEPTVFRNRDKEISCFVEAREYNGAMRIIACVKTAEEAFAIKDLLEDMIKAFRARKEESNENNMQ